MLLRSTPDRSESACDSVRTPVRGARPARSLARHQVGEERFPVSLYWFTAHRHHLERHFTTPRATRAGRPRSLSCESRSATRKSRGPSSSKTFGCSLGGPVIKTVPSFHYNTRGTRRERVSSPASCDRDSMQASPLDNTTAAPTLTPRSPPPPPPTPPPPALYPGRAASPVGLAIVQTAPCRRLQHRDGGLNTGGSAQRAIARSSTPHIRALRLRPPDASRSSCGQYSMTTTSSRRSPHAGRPASGHPYCFVAGPWATARSSTTLRRADAAAFSHQGDSDDTLVNFASSTSRSSTSARSPHDPVCTSRRLSVIKVTPIPLGTNLAGFAPTVRAAEPFDAASSTRRSSTIRVRAAAPSRTSPP